MRTKPCPEIHPFTWPCFFVIIKGHHSSILPTEVTGSHLTWQAWKVTQNYIDDLGYDILEYTWLPLLQCGTVKTDILFNGRLFY